MTNASSSSIGSSGTVSCGAINSSIGTVPAGACSPMKKIFSSDFNVPTTVSTRGHKRSSTTRKRLAESSRPY
jgi:hypothetical protein